MNTHAMLHDLEAIYKTIQQPATSEMTNIFLLDWMSELLAEVKKEDIEHFVDEYPALKEAIKRRSPESFLHRQPVVLALYYLIQRKRSGFERLWPLTLPNVQPLYTDLGIAQQEN